MPSSKRIRAWWRGIRAWLRGRARPFWRDIRWIAIGLAAIAALVLGYIGFDQHAVAAGRSFGDKLYLSLQLFAIESGNVSSPSWELEVARFLAPVVAVYAAVSAVATLLREQLQLLRVRLMRQHVVICGLGERGLALARGFNERGDRVVAVEQDDDARGIAECREEGIVVLIGDITDRPMLHKARVGRASHLVAVAGDDGVNAEVAADLPQLVPSHRRRPLTAFVHVTDPNLCRLLRQSAITAPATGSHRLDFFSIYEIAARILVRQYFPAAGDNGAGAGPDGMVVIGLGEMGEALMVHAARTWRTTRGESAPRLKVTVVDRAAEQKCASLSLRYPQLNAVCDLAQAQIEIEGPDFERAEFLSRHSGRAGGSVVFVCVDDDALGLTAAQALLPSARAARLPVVVRMSRHAGLAALVDRTGADNTLRAFPLLDLTCKPGLLLEGTRELLARVIHEDYLRGQRDRGETPATKAAVVEWEDLDEQFRESNRRHADHIGVKLSAVHCGLGPLTDWDAQLFEFVPEEVEELAQMEHLRWRDEREAENWKPGPVKDDVRKISPYLVDWGELPDDIREFDRTFVRGLPALLAQAGFQVYRLD
jgi:TrkA family protein/RyR domain-containing protein